MFRFSLASALSGVRQRRLVSLPARAAACQRRAAQRRAAACAGQRRVHPPLPTHPLRLGVCHRVTYPKSGHFSLSDALLHRTSHAALCACYDIIECMPVQSCQAVGVAARGAPWPGAYQRAATPSCCQPSACADGGRYSRTSCTALRVTGGHAACACDARTMVSAAHSQEAPLFFWRQGA